MRNSAVLALLTAAIFASNAAFAQAPLNVCYAKAATEDRLAVGRCLDAMLSDASKDMAAALASQRKAAVDLARVTGREKAMSALNVAQKQFLAYRNAQCQYILDAMDTGTGAGDAYRACMVRLTQQRFEELASNP